MHIRSAQQEIGLLMRQHGLLDRGWTQVLDNAKNRLGQCSFGKRQLSFSRSYLQLNDWEEIRDTALHEIAHALVGPGHGHGPVWRRKAREIGARPYACAQTPVRRTPHKWVGECPHCGDQLGRDRLTESARSSACSKCCGKFNGGRFDARFRFVWKENHGKILTSA